MLQQRDYQIKGTDRISQLAQQGFMRILLQLATGGGKTVMFAGLCQRYLQTNDRNVLILVHRKELLQQARKTIYNWYNLIAEPITAKTKHVPHARIYVAMVETAFKRLQKRPSYFPNIGIVIVDECHLLNFTKMLSLFPDTLRIGFTATPISASKKKPLKNYYEEIVTCIDIKGLIEIWQDDNTQGLVPNRTFRVKNKLRAGLHVDSRTGEFKESEMGAAFSNAKHVENTVDAYEKFCIGTKTLVFNCNISHSQLVHQAFLARGHNSRHLDSENCTDTERTEALEWLANTPDAILNNVGILTTGFDEPSVLSIIVNKATMSLSLWLQMTGRGARPYPGKKYFTIVDMGGNEKYHGDWSNERDWVDIFHNPDKPMVGGIAPRKECEECEAMIPAQARVCTFCGCVQSVKEQVYDPEELEFELVVKNNPFGISTQQVILNNLNRNPYAALHEIKHQLVAHARQTWKMKSLDDETAYKLLALYQERVEEWCGEQRKNYDTWHKDLTGKWFLDELKKVYDWEPKPLELSL